MLAWIILVPVTLLFILGSIASYDDDYRRSTLYIPSYLIIGIGCSIFWIVASRLLDNKNDLFVYSLWWDSLMMAAYYVLPLLILGVKPGTATLVGFGMVMTGLMVVKVYG